uniref:Uncharacterized protein n=1 Tax=Setaria italica TaxID=4555 RepID=K4ANQ8_SETIT
MLFRVNVVHFMCKLMHQLPIDCYNEEGCTLFYGLIGFLTEWCTTYVMYSLSSALLLIMRFSVTLSPPLTGFLFHCLPV